MAPQAPARAASQLTATTWLPLILQGLAQAAGAQTLYHTATRSGGSILAATGKPGKQSGKTGNKIGKLSGNDDAASAIPSLSAAQVAAITTSLTGV